MIRKFAHLVLPASLSVVALATAAQAANTSKGFSTVYDFCQQANCADGQDPVGGVIVDASGNLYGTTYAGGTGNNNGSACNANYYGCGTVYEIAPDGTETVLYSFCSQENCSDGALPQSGLVMDGSGNLYGTTTLGGNGIGGVFEIAPDGTETVLYNFPSNEPPYGLSSGLVMDASGDLFGTLQGRGGESPGAIFIALTSGGGGILYNFCHVRLCTDGDNPTGGLILDAAGNLYGTTALGGANNGGVVFEQAFHGNESVLYSFCGQANCTDGQEPTGSLVESSRGNFYGVTYAGGANGNGTAFELAANGAETVLHSFCSELQDGHCLDGAYPEAGLLEQSTSRRFYGTATQGGEGEYQNGVVFSLSGETEKPIYSFGQFADGFASTPYAGLLSYNGFLYGTAESGGWSGGGIVFKLGTRGAPAR
jgi:uncharacterized repeat protein (TIGR03803 family)